MFRLGPFSLSLVDLLATSPVKVKNLTAREPVAPEYAVKSFKKPENARKRTSQKTNTVIFLTDFHQKSRARNTNEFFVSTNKNECANVRAPQSPSLLRRYNST